MSDDTKWTVGLLVVATLLAVGFGLTLNMASNERDIEIAKCREAGGIYTPQYGVPAICFAPGVVLKGDSK